MYDVGCKKSDRIWEAERMKNYKRSGAAGFFCAAALFLGTGVLALGTVHLMPWLQKFPDRSHPVR